MKKILFVLILTIFQAAAFAQFKIIAQGPVFNEPEEGYARILQLKNGNTMFFLITFKEGLDLKIYDAKHKQKITKHLNPKYGKLKSPNMEAIFESNGDAVFMVSEQDEGRTILHRLIVDGTKGIIKKEEMIAELLPVKLKHGWAAVFEGDKPMTIEVRKDPLSDGYAVVLLNGIEPDPYKRFEVIMYDGGHNVVSRSFYTSPENQYKHLKYIDMTIVDEKTVYIFLYGYNTRTGEGKENALLLATLEKSSGTLNMQELVFAKDLNVDRGVVKYNPVTKKLIFIASFAESEKRNTKKVAKLVFIDPFKKTVDEENTIFPDAANEKSLEIFGKKEKFEGQPQNFFINPDGSFSVVYEEINKKNLHWGLNPSSGLSGGFASSGAPGGAGSAGSVSHASMNGSRTNAITKMGNLAVTTFDQQGKTINSYFIPKEHGLRESNPTSFYHARREGSAEALKAGNQFKTFAFVNGKNNNYILFNDLEENMRRNEKGKQPVVANRVTDFDAFCFTLSGNTVMPVRTYFFEEPKTKREHTLASFGVSDYDRERNVYATLMLLVGGDRQMVRLVWMEP